MTDHWYSFGVCPCDAHTIIEMWPRFAVPSYMGVK